MQWYYAEKGQQKGPVDEQALAKLAQAGTITDDTLVWHEGMQDWAAYAAVAPPAVPAVPGAWTPPKRERKLKLAQRQQAAPPANTCRHCGREFPADQLVEHQGANFCAECEPSLFQHIPEAAEAAVPGGMGETPNAELTAHARACLSGNWGQPIGVCVLYGLVAIGIGIVSSLVGAVIPFLGNILQLLLLPPFSLGLCIFFLALVRRQGTEISMLGSGFSRYGAALGAFFFRQLIIALCTIGAALPGIALMAFFAWSKRAEMMPLAAVLFVPGIIVAIMVTYMLAMTFYVLADSSTTNCFDAMKQSRLMMRGVKWKFLCLNCRFIGWALLCMLTFFIGYLWLVPYMQTAFAAFYDDVKGRAAVA